jgi:hypothetical protein
MGTMQLDDGGRGPYDTATSANTDPSFLTDPDTGKSVLGDGVEVNLDDLTGYSGNLDQIQTNYVGLSRTTTQALRSMTTGAFAAGGAGGFVWSGFFNRLASHNIGQLEQFNASIAVGIRNVAMAAQTVANVYADTDEASGASIRAIDYAFGDRSKAPDSLPSWYVDRVPTFNEVVAQQPQAGPVQADAQPTTGAPVVTGNVTTTTVRLPDGRTMTTVTEQGAATGPSKRSSSTRSTYIDGQLVSVTSSATVGNRTTTTTTVDERVVSRDTVTVTQRGDDLRTEQRSESYTYDATGKEVDKDTTVTSTTVGRERPPESRFAEDPSLRAANTLLPG